MNADGQPRISNNALAVVTLLVAMSDPKEKELMVALVEFGAGNVAVYGTGGVMTHLDAAAHSGPSVLIPRKGPLDTVYDVDEPF